MNIEFDQEPGDKSSKGGGSNSRLLLLVLLLLVAVFGYLFYFTDLIKPRQEAQAPEPVQTGQVKQPIPPRPEGQPSGAAPAEQAKPTEVTPPATVPPEPAKAAPEQKAPEKGKTEPPASVKPAAPAAKKEQPKPAEPPKAPVAKTEQPKPAAPAMAPANAKQKALPSKTEAKQKAVASTAGAKEAKKTTTAPVKPKTAAVKTAVKKAATAVKAQAADRASAAETGEYTLRIGEYVVPTAMEKDKAKVRDAGLTPVVKEGSKKKEPMVRLFFGEFADQETARKELQRLRDATVEGFVLKEGGKYRVYAGSYFVEERAVKEQERLEALGFRLTLRKAGVSVPTLLLTAGKYASRGEAVKDVAKLKKKGLSPAVVANVK